jgi:hypothetical protein
MSKEETERRTLELAVWKMSHGGLPDYVIKSLLRVSSQDLSRLRGEKAAA